MRRAWGLMIAVLVGCASDGPGVGDGGDTQSSESDTPEDLPPDSTEADTDESTGDPMCPEPPPCDACTCEAGEWACECPTPLPEAGFVDIAALDYAIALPDAEPTPLTSTAHRQFWAFQPADEPIESPPLFVFFNGGPAVSSAMLLGLNVGPMTFDPAATGGADLGPNPHSWTRLGNLLWIDARHVGLSHSLLDDPSDQSARQAALEFASFNAYLDAADFVRVLLEFLAEHPELADDPVVLVAESYGGTRAELMLDMLLHPHAYEDGERRLIDPSLTERIAAHHLDRFGDPMAGPEVIVEQFGRQILIQPALTGVTQQLTAGAMFEQPGSIVDTFATDLGLDFVPCSEQVPPCSPYDNALDFVAAAGRSPYDLRAPGSWLNDVFGLVSDRCNDASVLAGLLGVELAGIDGLSPEMRSQAWRMVSVDAYPTDAAAGDMDEALGALAPWDRYFLVFEVGALAQFRGYEADQLEVDPAHPHYGEHLLRNLLWVDTFITSANYDIVIHTPAIPDALADYDSIVADVTVEPEEWTIDYQPDGFPEWPSPGSRTIAVRTYEASHAVTLDSPGEMLADVEAWLAE